MSLAAILTKNRQKQPRGQTARENSCYSNVVMPRETSPGGEKNRRSPCKKRKTKWTVVNAPYSVPGYKNDRWSSPISESSSKSQEVCYTPAYL